MNALVKKEIRLLLPSLMGCAALSLLNYFYNSGPYFSRTLFHDILLGVCFVATPAIALFMALNSFGGEISAGTFSMLLSQPVSRIRLWRTKTSLLALSLVMSWAVWWTFMVLGAFNHSSYGTEGFRSEFITSILYLLVIYSGSLWTVLLFRQVAAAFWFTLLIPGLLMAVIVGLFGPTPDRDLTPMAEFTLCIYSIVGFIFARWLFLRAQDVAWTGGKIAMPEMGSFTFSLSRSKDLRTWRPIAALFRKEVQLHQSQIILGGALLLLHLIVLLVRKFDHSAGETLSFILDIFWGLWLVMPMLVGAAAIAEERKLNTLAGQLSLPVKRHTQFAIKLFVVVALSLVLGIIMPLLLEGTRILPELHFPVANFSLGTFRFDMLSAKARLFLNVLIEVNGALPFLTMAGIAMAIGILSYFASSLCSNTLQALSSSVLVMAVFVLLFGSANAFGRFHDFILWYGPLIYLIGVPVSVLTVIGITFSNSQLLTINWKYWLRTLIILLLAIAGTALATTATYHRVWEKLTPFEPAHQSARLAFADSPRLDMEGTALTVMLPDGRVWIGSMAIDAKKFSPWDVMIGNQKLGAIHGQFLSGSDWATVICRRVDGQLVGLKKDGTLWVSAQPAKSALTSLPLGSPTNLFRFGTESDWKSATMSPEGVLMVRTNGSLWLWPTKNLGTPQKEIIVDLTKSSPHQLGTENNWQQVFRELNQARLKKTDGSVWSTTYYTKSGFPTVTIEPGFSIQKLPYAENKIWRGQTFPLGVLSFRLGISEDGTLRIAALRKFDIKSQNSTWFPADFPIGTENDWAAIAGPTEKSALLKKDGTLWSYNWITVNRGNDFDREWLDSSLIPSMKQMGSHNDWIAITSIGADSFLSLAKDGSLWYWPGSRAYYYTETDQQPTLLDVSHKPQLVANIFDAVDK